MPRIFDQACRICESEDNLEVFSNNVNEDILSMLRDVLHFELKADDYLPHHICLSCKFTLEDIHLFKSLYKKTYSKYKFMIDEIQVSGKLEDATVPDPAERDGSFPKAKNEIIEINHNLNAESKECSSDPYGYRQGGSDSSVTNSHYHEMVLKEEITLWDVDGVQDLQMNGEDIGELGSEELFSLKQHKKPFPVLKESKQRATINPNLNPDKIKIGRKSSSCDQALKKHKANSKPYNKASVLPKDANNQKSLEVGRQSDLDIFECDSYDKSYKTSRSYINHTTTSYSNHIEYKCEQCNKFFKTFLGLKSHMYKCKECGKLYSAQTLKEHLALHVNPDLFKCDLCGKAFNTSKALKFHRIDHSNPNTYKCDLCKQTFSSSNMLRAHQIVLSNPNINICNEYGKSFSTTSILKQHRVHHSNPKFFACGICEMLFKTSAAYKDHMALHSNPERYKCNLCGKSFNTQATLKYHQIIHSNQNALKYEVCNKSFSLPRGLDRHVKTYHTNNISKCI